MFMMQLFVNFIFRQNFHSVRASKMIAIMMNTVPIDWLTIVIVLSLFIWPGATYYGSYGSN